MSIEAELQEFITGKLDGKQRNVVVVGPDDPLVSSGRIDSLALLQLLAFIEERFGVDLVVRASPEDLDTIRGLARSIRGEQQDG